MKTSENKEVITPLYYIGQEVYYMKFGKPTKNPIIGYAIVYGEFKDLSSKGEAISIVYYFDSFTHINENEVFDSKEGLQNYLFSEL